MTPHPLPREGATIKQVRIAAWQHAHHAHVHAGEAEAQAARRALQESRRHAGLARMHAEVSQALLSAMMPAFASGALAEERP